MWPVPSDPQAFAERRRKLAESLESPAMFVAGRARPRNFAANVHGFRAESHFLYFVGRAMASQLVKLNNISDLSCSAAHSARCARRTHAQRHHPWFL